MEFLCGLAFARGMNILVAKGSSLLGANVPMEQKFYGYDTQDINMTLEDDGFKLSFTDRDPSKIPTAEEMEKRYDHSGKKA